MTLGIYKTVHALNLKKELSRSQYGNVKNFRQCPHQALPHINHLPPHYPPPSFQEGKFDQNVIDCLQLVFYLLDLSEKYHYWTSGQSGAQFVREISPWCCMVLSIGIGIIHGYEKECFGLVYC